MTSKCEQSIVWAGLCSACGEVVENCAYRKGIVSDSSGGKSSSSWAGHGEAGSAEYRSNAGPSRLVRSSFAPRAELDC